MARDERAFGMRATQHRANFASDLRPDESILIWKRMHTPHCKVGGSHDAEAGCPLSAAC
jgi:hypothetical protein